MIKYMSLKDTNYITRYLGNQGYLVEYILFNSISDSEEEEGLSFDEDWNLFLFFIFFLFLEG